MGKTFFDDSRFYNNAFENTNIENCLIKRTLIENSRFLTTSMVNVKMTSVSFISVGLIASTFKKIKFEDVDIQESFINGCKFYDSHLGGSIISGSIIEFTEFHSVTYDDTLDIADCLISIKYFDSKKLEPNNRYADLDFLNEKKQTWISSMEKIYALPQTLSKSTTRNYPMVSRLFLEQPDVGEITHVPGIYTGNKSTQPTQPTQPTIKKSTSDILFEVSKLHIPANQTAYDPVDGKVELFTYMEENPDTVVFLYGKDFFIVTKESITRTITELSKPPVDGMLAKKPILIDNANIVENFDFKRLPKDMMISVNDFKLVLDYAKFGNDKVYRIYEIVEKKVAESAVSFRVLYAADNSSASHYKEGDYGKIYQLRIISTKEVKSTGGSRATKGRKSKSATWTCKRKNTTRK